MKNIVITVMLFSLLVGSLFIFNNNFKKICDELLLRGSEIEEYLDNNEMDVAYNLSLELLNYLDSKDSIPAVYLNYVDYDLLINEALKVCIYIKNEDISEAQTSVHLIVFSANHLKSMHKVNIKNIF